MLDLQDLSLQDGSAPDELHLLSEVSAQFPVKHFVAILGPSGCGKSTLLKVIAGLRQSSQGQINWEGRNLDLDGDFDPSEVGYVPQFSIAFDSLSVWESVEAALQLRVADLDEDEREDKIEKILKDVGLDEISERRVQLLSGGQKRRLALALEMVSSPRLLLCDEVTSGLDPKAEDEIVRLMHELSRHDSRIVLSVTHSLRHLALYDSVLVLYKGHVAYHGAPGSLLHYFNVDHSDELFPRLATRQPEDWHRSWKKHRPAYYKEIALASNTTEMSMATLHASSVAAEFGSSAWRRKLVEELESEETHEPLPPPPPPAEEPMPHREDDGPSALTQFRVLFARRWKLFFRDRGQLILQLALLLGFPCLVVIFALDGLPQLKHLSGGTGNLLQQIQNEMLIRTESMKTGSLISGLIMFQVVLLSLMGSNNAAREIAGERLIFEKEKFAGLKPIAYVASKAAFLGVLILAQSIWMGVFVNLVVQFPGNLLTQILLLTLVNASLTFISLGISSSMKSAEQASLVSVYLVGFQLPLSGAVLALPATLNWLTRPFIASYWGWSGFIQTLRDTGLYEAVKLVTQTQLASVSVAVWVLTFHMILGLLIAYTGCKSSRWE